METQERIAFIADIADKDEGIGKNAMMEFLYLLQTVYKVPLNYDFDIYTYGPYSRLAMSDLEFAKSENIIDISQTTFVDGRHDFNLVATKEGKEVVSNQGQLLNQYDTVIDKVLATFQGKNTNYLELYATTVFVFNACRDNNLGLSKDDVCKTVKQVKPHFSPETISSVYSDLLKNHFVDAEW